MIHVKGDALKLFEETPESALIHQVNCKGVMGAGIAKQIADKYPQHLYDYKAVSPKRLGDFVVTDVSENRCIIGIFGQDGYGRGKCHTDYNAFKDGMILALYDPCKTRSHHPIIIPKYIGCGLAGGDWNTMEKLLLDIERRYDVEFTCVEYYGG